MWQCLSWLYKFWDDPRLHPSHLHCGISVHTAGEGFVEEYFPRNSKKEFLNRYSFSFGILGSNNNSASVQWFPINTLLHSHVAFLVFYTWLLPSQWHMSHTWWAARTHCFHPKPMVYFRDHLWGCIFYRFENICNDLPPPSGHHTEQFHCPNIPLFSSCDLSPQALTTIDLFTVSIVLSFSEHHTYGIIH